MKKILAGIAHNFPSARSMGAAFLSALLFFLAAPGETNTGAIIWITLVPLMYAITLDDSTPLKAAATGLFFGLFSYISLLYWIIIVLGNYGNLPLWATVPALLLLALYMSLYPALFSFLACRFKNRFSLIWAAPVIWVALDWLRSVAFSGFPWMDLAYSQFRTPAIMQITDIGGHHTVTFLIVMVNCLVFSTIRSRVSQECRNRKNLLSPLLATLLIAICLIYNYARFNQIEKILEVSPKLNVAVVQGNIDQGQKWVPALQRETLNKYLKISHDIVERKQPELIIWPETAMPFYLKESRFLSRIQALALSENETCVLTGAPHREAGRTPRKPTYFNSAFLIPGGNGDILRYDKQHLVPFGEYVPMKKLLPFLAPFVETVADFTAGSSITPMPCHEGRVGVLICFESIFPALARAHTNAGANLLVNLTNDAWYGRSSAPWQHLSMVVFRAVENRRSIARSANTGVSCFIDPLGRMGNLSPLFEEFAANEFLPIIEERSFFTYGFGSYFGILCMLALIVLTLFHIKIPAEKCVGEGDQDVH